MSHFITLMIATLPQYVVYISTLYWWIYYLWFIMIKLKFNIALYLPWYSSEMYCRLSRYQMRQWLVTRGGWTCILFVYVYTLESLTLQNTHIPTMFWFYGWVCAIYAEYFLMRLPEKRKLLYGAKFCFQTCNSYVCD